MRPIKLRAWDKRLDKFVNFEEDLPEIKDIGNRNPDFVIEIIQDDRFVWQQFTGLHDKNGTEIWEGDVLNDGNYNYFEVKIPNIFRWQTSSFSVAGNIYENPELLIS